MFLNPKFKHLKVSQAEAQLAFNNWNQRTDVVVLDTETTGLYDSEICEISVVDIKGNVLFDSLVRPVHPIPPDAKRVHGISNDMVKDSPNWLEVWEKLYPIIENKLILIYNAEFDRRLMAESFAPYDLDDEKYNQIENLKTACIMRTYANLIGASRWRKLTEAAGRVIEHRALDDARAAAEVVIRNYRPEFTEEEFQKLQWWDEMERISRRIRHIGHQIRELNATQTDLLRQQKELLLKLAGMETSTDPACVAASLDFDEQIVVDIEDDDLPF